MSFNEDELKKIRRATTGRLKKSTRKSVSHDLLVFKPRIGSLKTMEEVARSEKLQELMATGTNLTWLEIAVAE